MLQFFQGVTLPDSDTRHQASACTRSQPTDPHLSQHVGAAAASDTTPSDYEYSEVVSPKGERGRKEGYFASFSISAVDLRAGLTTRQQL